jgi:hypothetical protein
MADDERTEDEPWGDGPDVPPLSDTENPLADDDASEEERGDWLPPVP